MDQGQPSENSLYLRSIKQNASRAVKFGFSVTLCAALAGLIAISISSRSGFADDSLQSPDDSSASAPPMPPPPSTDQMSADSQGDMPPPDDSTAPPPDAPPDGSAASDDSTPPPPPDASDSTSDSLSDSGSGSLPDIKARLIQLQPIKMSVSKRVYLLKVHAVKGQNSDSQDDSLDNPETPPELASAVGTKPPVNKLLLLRNGDENIMALRVLRDVTGTSQVIAKRIKTYGDHTTLTIGDDYYGIEKVSDVIPPPPPTDEDKSDMEEVDPAPLPFDPELDAGSSPEPKGSHDSDSDDKAARKLGMSVEDNFSSHETQRHWFSAALGLLRNTPGADQAAAYYTGGGFRYGYDFIRHVFCGTDDPIDLLSIEAGVYFYKIVGLDNQDGSDVYNVMPISGTLKYTYFLSQNFALFGYGGLLKNQVISSSQSSPDRVANLSMVTAAFGAGALLRVGPQWYGRLDAGIDMLGLSLMLRF